MFEMVIGDTIWSGGWRVLEVTGDAVCLSACETLVVAV